MAATVPRPRWSSSLLALFAPGPCRQCGSDLEGEARGCLCLACWASLGASAAAARCPRCWLPGGGAAGSGCPRCDGPGPLGRNIPIVSPWEYRDAPLGLHRRLKFDGESDLAPPLARRMAAAWRLAVRDPPELCVPVPPDPLRLPPRRWATLRLARAVAREISLPLAPNALRKVRPTRPQTSRGRDSRLAALRGSFRALPRLVGGTSLLLVDDVTTTGATLAEAVRALRDAGAHVVGALTLARTPRRG